MINKSFFINFYGFFEFFSQNIIGKEVGSRRRVIQEHKCPKESLKLSLPGSYQNLISIFKLNPADFGRSRVTRWSEVCVCVLLLLFVRTFCPKFCILKPQDNVKIRMTKTNLRHSSENT